MNKVNQISERITDIQKKRILRHIVSAQALSAAAALFLGTGLLFPVSVLQRAYIAIVAIVIQTILVGITLYISIQ